MITKTFIKNTIKIKTNRNLEGYKHCIFFKLFSLNPFYIFFLNITFLTTCFKQNITHYHIYSSHPEKKKGNIEIKKDTLSSISGSPRGRTGIDDPRFGTTSPTELERPSLPMLMLRLLRSILSLLLSSLADCDVMFCCANKSCC